MPGYFSNFLMLMYWTEGLLTVYLASIVDQFSLNTNIYLDVSLNYLRFLN